MQIGLFSDNHSSGLEALIASFMKGCDIICCLGDTVEIEDDYRHIVQALSPSCQTSIPVYAIPGNYEAYGDWHAACDILGKKYPDFHDMSQRNMLEMKGFTFLFVPGTEKYFSGFRISQDLSSGLYGNGYVTNVSDLCRQAETKDNIILFSHEPPRQYGAYGTDRAVSAVSQGGKIVLGRVTKEYVETGRYSKQFTHEGSDLMRRLVDRLSIRFVFSGHIHEALGGVTKEGEPVGEHQLAPTLFYNPGPAKNGCAAIIHIDERGMRVEYTQILVNQVSGYAGLHEGIRR